VQGAGGAQLLAPRGKRELCARQSAHEVAASHVAAQLHSAELAIDRAPRHRWTLATPPIPGHNAVTLQPLCRDNRRERALLLLQVLCRGRAAIEKRPTARPRRVAALVIGTLPSRQPPNVHPPLPDGTMRRGDRI